MDPLTVLGAAGSLVNLIDATGHLARKLYRLARGVRAARKNIRKFARKLSMFSWASGRACACLLQHYSSETELRTLSKVEKRDFLKDAEESAREIMINVENITPRMRSMKSSLGLWSKIKWAQRKSDVRDLTLEMSALETSLTLLMTTVIYEVQLQQKEAPEYLKMTMGQINNFIEGAELIATQLDRVAGAHHGSANSSRRFRRLLDNVNDIATEQLDIADRERDATGLYERGRWVPKKEVNPISRTGTRQRHSRTMTQTRETRLGSPPPPLPHERIVITIPATSQGKGKGKQTSREVPRASSSRGMQNPNDDLGSENVGSGNARSIQPPDTHLPRRAAMPYFSAPSASDEYEEIDGYISQTMRRNSKSSSQIITARLYPNLGMNVISRALATQLGLNITVLIDEDIARTLPVDGSTRDQVNHSAGHALFVWHTPTEILCITCTVFNHEIVPGVPFALGKPYVQQVETARGNVTS